MVMAGKMAGKIVGKIVEKIDGNMYSQKIEGYQLITFCPTLLN
jgi:hypothetical protein